MFNIKKVIFFDNLYNKLFFFSEIIIIFFEFVLTKFNANVFERVSIVFPDFETTINNIFWIFLFS